MAQPDELQPVHITRGDFLYKIGEQGEWTRLPSPIDNVKHNCYGITFDHGVFLTQKHREQGSICCVKLILKPPAMEVEEDLPIIRAECVEIHSPSFIARNRCMDKAKAIEHAKTLPLASLDRTITAVKLRNLSTLGPDGNILHYDYELKERIWELIERGYRATRAAQTNSRKRRIWTPPSREPSSSSEVIIDKGKPRVRLPTPQATTPPQPFNNSSELPADKDKPRVHLPIPQAMTPSQPPNSPDFSADDRDKPRVLLPTPQATTPPQPPNNSTEIPADKDNPMEQLPTPQAATPPRPPNNSTEIPDDKDNPRVQSAAPRTSKTPQQPPNNSSEISTNDKDNLSERLQAHQAATAEGEHKLRQGLEKERKALLRAVTVAINGEWDKKVAAAVTEYRAWAASAVEKIITEG